MSMQNSNDSIGNRTRDLPTCTACPRLSCPIWKSTWHTTGHLAQLIGSSQCLFPHRTCENTSTSWVGLQPTPLPFEQPKILVSKLKLLLHTLHLVPAQYHVRSQGVSYFGATVFDIIWSIKSRGMPWNKYIVSTSPYTNVREEIQC
jgi:hypothetical protein